MLEIIYSRKEVEKLFVNFRPAFKKYENPARDFFLERRQLIVVATLYCFFHNHLSRYKKKILNLF